MNISFDRIALIGKTDAPRIGDILPKLYHYLKAKRKTVVVESDCARFIPGAPTALPVMEIANRADLAIVIGCDGTLLSAARDLANHDIPLVGVNLGRLGFLVDISPAEVVSYMEDIFAGRYHSEERYMIRA